jgi:hypothetical protein
VVLSGALGDDGGLAEVVVPGDVVVVVVVDAAVELKLDVLVEVGALADDPHAARTAVTIATPAATITRFTIPSVSASPQCVIGCEEASLLRRTRYPRRAGTPSVVLSGYANGERYARRGTEKASPKRMTGVPKGARIHGGAR